jgi:hypothetical protein
VPVAAPGEPDAADAEEAGPDDGTERTFIRLEDRPPVGEDALAEPDQQDE